MKRIVLPIIVQCILLTSAAAALAQSKNPPPPGQEPPKGAAPVKASQKTQEAAPGQKAPSERMPESPRPQYKPVVFQLRNAYCKEVAEILDRVFFEAIIVPSPRTNTIIYSGPEEWIPEVTELIGKVDLPGVEDDASELTIIPVRYGRVEEIADQVMKMMAGRSLRDVRVAADKSRSTLLIRGPKTVTEMAQMVVNELDKPAGAVNLEFAFFHADLNRKEPAGVMPADLAQVAEELRRFGMVELMGRLSTIAVENDKFMVGGSIAEKIPEVSVRGELITAPSDGSVKLRLMARLMLDRESASSPPPPAEKGGDNEKASPRAGKKPSYELDTTVYTKRGDYIVLGSAPTGWAPGESVILVMHVQP